VSDIELVKKRCIEAQFYAEARGIYVRITHGDNDGFVGVDEETGAQYRVEYSEVDLAKDKFYKLVLVE
jgi:hypothetical protein